MKLTEQHIQSLYEFTKQHYVEYYDLQTELVDHLANDIEVICNEQPHLSLEAARDLSFKKFGVFGFMSVVEERSRVMSKRYMNYLWKELKAWLKTPHGLVIIGLFLILYVMFSSSLAYYFAYGLYIILLILGVLKFFQLKHTLKRREKKSQKKWLMEEVLFKQAGLILMMIALNILNVIILTEDYFTNTYFSMFMALLFTVVYILHYLALYVLPSKADKLLSDAYPEYNLV